MGAATGYKGSKKEKGEIIMKGGIVLRPVQNAVMRFWPLALLGICIVAPWTMRKIWQELRSK